MYSFIVSFSLFYHIISLFQKNIYLLFYFVFFSFVSFLKKKKFLFALCRFLIFRTSSQNHPLSYSIYLLFLKKSTFSPFLFVLRRFPIFRTSSHSHPLSSPTPSSLCRAPRVPVPQTPPPGWASRRSSASLAPIRRWSSAASETSRLWSWPSR